MSAPRLVSVMLSGLLLFGWCSTGSAAPPATQVFEWLTRTPGSFDAALGSIGLLREHGVEVILKSVVTGVTASDGTALGDLAARLGCRIIADPRIVVGRDGNRTPLELRVPESDLAQVLPSPLVTGGSPRGFDGPGEMAVCAGGRRVAHIAANGDLLPCPVFPHSAGNILDRPFREMWQTSPLLKKLRSIRPADLRVCSSCAKRGVCGRCPAQALSEDGDLLGPSSWACATARVLTGAWSEATT
jgi:radical SAM protein with 4Fe4S-binding SPASM domain